MSAEKKAIEPNSQPRRRLTIPENITGQIRRFFAADYKLFKIAGLSHDQALAMCIKRYEKY